MWKFEKIVFYRFNRLAILAVSRVGEAWEAPVMRTHFFMQEKDSTSGRERRLT